VVSLRRVPFLSAGGISTALWISRQDATAGQPVIDSEEGELKRLETPSLSKML